MNWPDAARGTLVSVCCVQKAEAAPKAAAGDQPAKAEKEKKAPAKGEKPAAKAPAEKKPAEKKWALRSDLFVESNWWRGALYLHSRSQFIT